MALLADFAGNVTVGVRSSADPAYGCHRRCGVQELSALEPLELSVPDVVLERSSGKEVSALEPLEHSVPAGASDSKHIRDRITMEPLEHSVPDLALLWTIDLFPRGQRRTR